MAPKSKKNIKNGFYYFMKELRELEESKGRKFSGLKEVSDFANPLWTAMSFEEKEFYNRKASLAKGTDEDSRHKFTSLGVSYADIDAEAREQEEYMNVMLQTIRNTVRNLDRTTTLLTHKFYLCHVNYFYKGDNDFYSVAEIALSEFNLKDGLLNTIHFFVDPGKIPLGLRFEAKDWAEKTHGIPYDWKCGEKDYYKIFTKIRNFLTKDNLSCIPPVYTMPDSLNSNMCLSAVKSALTTLCEASNENPIIFRVYPFPQLFFEIRNKCVQTDEGVGTLMPSVAIVENEIEKDVFSYAKDLGCPFHEEKDLTIHCSLSIVTRWVYTICDHCCKHVGISLELGKHCPRDADVNWDYKYTRTVGKSSKDSESSSAKKKNDFMPTIIDHGKLKEIREQQLLEEQESLRKAEGLRPPRSMIGAAGPLNDRMIIGRGVRQIPEETPWPISGRGKLL
ncbi:germ-plasm component protein maelstrom isoform X1 [Rhodnius prolixus]